MKLERSDVDYPLWRKKADSSLLNHKGTTIPGWGGRLLSLHLIALAKHLKDIIGYAIIGVHILRDDKWEDKYDGVY